jgi:hypothetical protein
MVSLGPHSAVWIPYGFATIVIHTPTEEQNQKSKDDQGLALAVAWSLAFLSKELCQQVSQKTWAAIESWKDEHFEKMKATPVWSARAEVWAKFKEGCR